MKRQCRHDIFISYQWDNQKEVMLIRNKLEKAGFSCWMDIGQMGGGDQLYNEIYKGIFHAQVMLAFISPRFILSDYCLKEVNLADLLRLPIIPVMVEKTPWPPPGSLAMILSQHIYIDLAGTGGHGGCGKDADWSMKMRELIRRLRLYTSTAKVMEVAACQESEAQHQPLFEVVEAIEAAPVGSSALALTNSSLGITPENLQMNDSFDTEAADAASAGGHADQRVPCCVAALSFPSMCAIL